MMKKRIGALGKKWMVCVLAAALAGGMGTGVTSLRAESDDFSMVETEITLMVGETDFVEVELAADISYTESSLTWSSSDSSIVSVDSDGVITALEEGTAAITASMPDGSSESCTVTVSGYLYPEIDDENWKKDDSFGDPDDYSETPPFTALTIPKQVTIYTGETYFMELSYEPQEADEETIAWKSSNPNVASVDESGLVTALKTGTVRIIAMTPNDITATCTLTVQKPQIKLNKSKAKLKVGKKIRIIATCSPDALPAFKSQNKKIATVTANGMVKAKKKGKTVIVVKANGVSKKFNVTVVR